MAPHEAGPTIESGTIHIDGLRFGALTCGPADGDLGHQGRAGDEVDLVDRLGIAIAVAVLATGEMRHVLVQGAPASDLEDLHPPAHTESRNSGGSRCCGGGELELVALDVDATGLGTSRCPVPDGIDVAATRE